MMDLNSLTHYLVFKHLSSYSIGCSLQFTDIYHLQYLAAGRILVCLFLMLLTRSLFFGLELTVTCFDHWGLDTVCNQMLVWSPVTGSPPPKFVPFMTRNPLWSSLVLNLSI